MKDDRGHAGTSPHVDSSPWDIGRAQPAIAALADAGLIRGRVLDVGCGSGEHVLMAAGLGLDATGVDIAAGPLAIAEDKARSRGLSARFLQRDAVRLGDLGRFDTVLDCGLFHAMTGAARTALVESVQSVLTPGGRWFVLGGWGPHTLERSQITAAFLECWQIDAIEPTTVDTNLGTRGMPAVLVCLTRA